MAKTNITLYSSTPSSNTDINNINIDENCPASGLNNAIRELMAHLKNVDTGSQALTALSVTGNVSVGGTFTSTGIDDNASSTAMTLDSTGRLLVGKTSTNFATEGVEIGGADGKIFITRDNNSLYLNRNSSDGNIVQFYKDSTEVGSIGTQGSRLSIGSGDVNLNFNASANSIYPISDPAAGTLADNAVDLGAGLARFKDLYLSGGAYIGGTGSANLLDSYEEGSFTPTAEDESNNTGTASEATGYYRKIGGLVHCEIRLNNINTTGLTSSNDFVVGGFPFIHSSRSGSVFGIAGDIYFASINVDYTGNIVGLMSEGADSIKFVELVDSAGDHDILVSDLTSGSADLLMSITYHTEQ